MPSSIDVPTVFEDYLRHIKAEPFDDGSTCPGCMEHPTAYKLNDASRSRICEACLRNFHGHDAEEMRLVHGLLGGVVKAALDASVSIDLIRAVVNETIDGYVEHNARMWGQLEGRLATSQGEVTV